MKSINIATLNVLKRLEENLAFKEIRRMVEGFCTRWYLVGGRVYRTLSEELHSEKCNAGECDWDFICFDSTSQPIQFDSWIKTRGPGSVPQVISNPYQTSNYNFSNVKIQKKSLERRKLSSRFEHPNFGKVDFIAIEDIKPEGGGQLDDYFAAVPLDVQAIALDFKGKKIIGDIGKSACCRRSMRIKNPFSLSNEGRDPQIYTMMKIETMRPQKWTISRETRHFCYCYPDDPKALFANGCKCGGI